MVHSICEIQDITPSPRIDGLCIDIGTIDRRSVLEFLYPVAVSMLDLGTHVIVIGIKRHLEFKIEKTWKI